MKFTITTFYVAPGEIWNVGWAYTVEWKPEVSE